MRTPAEDLAKFNESVSILVKAYLNDTLIHGNCTACAVGNLIAHKMGTQITRGAGGDTFANGVPTDWYEAVINSFDYLHDDNRKEAALEQVKITGYSLRHVKMIEHAFEHADEITAGDPVFNGLMAVVDVLASIHGVDLETTEAARKMFVKV